MIKIPFSKYQANGNDFILISLESLDKKTFNSLLISRLCNRSYGIGANGLFFISSSKKYDFFLDYYNSDGSWEAFCANGSRCAAKFIYSLTEPKDGLMFETGAGVHTCMIETDGLVSMSLKIPIYKSKSIVLEGVNGFFIDSGARHFVCESDVLNDKYVFEVGRKIRNATNFQPKGINVNFYHVIDNNHVQIKTYEKGVEEIMLSCASGSAAVVFHLAQNGIITSPTTTVSGGGKLIYTFKNDWGGFYSKGPAEHCFSGEFDLGNYQ